MTILRKTIKTILVGLVSSIGFLAVAATVLFFTVDQQNIKDYLESKFYAKTGYTLKILGKADFGLSPHLSLRVYNAHITPPNAKENTPSFIQVKSIKMALKWPELLDGKVYIKKLTIEQPVVHLIIDKENQQIPALEHAYLQDNHPIQLVAHLTDRNPLLTQTLLTKPKKIPKHKKKPRFNPDLHVKAFSVKDATIIYENKKKNQKVVLEHLSMHNPTFGLRRKTHQSHSLAPWLHLLETHGRLAISDIWMGQLHINQVKMHYNLTDGKLTLSPVRYRFNDTPGVANFILYDKGNHLRVGLKNRLNDANLVYSPINDDRSSKGLAFATMPLLLDIDSGKLSVNTYIYADITDLADLDKHLNGSIRLALHDGDIKRFNLAYELRRLEDRINRIEDTAPPKKKTTPFDSFTLQIQLKDGKAKPFPVVLKAPDFSFNGLASLDLAKEPAWMHMRVYIKPEAHKYKKLEGLLNRYLKDINQGSIPLEFDGPLYTPSKLAILVDDGIAEDILNNVFSAWPENLKHSIVAKLQAKLKKSLKKMQKRLNEG